MDTLPAPMIALFAGAIVATVGLGLIALSGQFFQRSIPVVQRPVLTKAEAIFHEKLVEAIARMDGIAIHAQMAMGAFIQPDPRLKPAKQVVTYRQFSQWRPDFVLVDRSWRVRLIIELDDPTHDARKDANRDRLTSAAGIRTVRFVSGRHVTVDEIRRRLQEALSG
ncbi:DUF2726 domain-containing protein [Sphingomonas sp. 3-13AW]|uniref:DUF2726 domain-containing protein n=1 Tax=Sphingomonas sp. 3-13AW TaxID=3050450 RepID=UPI003BB76681